MQKVRKTNKAMIPFRNASDTTGVLVLSPWFICGECLLTHKSSHAASVWDKPSMFAKNEHDQGTKRSGRNNGGKNFPRLSHTVNIDKPNMFAKSWGEWALTLSGSPGLHSTVATMEVRIAEEQNELAETMEEKNKNFSCVRARLSHTVNIVSGVPRSRRGDIWQLLVEQHQLSSSQTDGNTDGDVTYEDLLKQLTPHQHAILIDLGENFHLKVLVEFLLCEFDQKFIRIDLFVQPISCEGRESGDALSCLFSGRTFPNHPYFSRQLGAGQLSLFNLLKAYSLIDKEVGYCQGLSFVAGILLMHVSSMINRVALRKHSNMFGNVHCVSSCGNLVIKKQKETLWTETLWSIVKKLFWKQVPQTVCQLALLSLAL